MNWKTGKWLVLDTETTGLKPNEGAKIWEIGWAEVEDTSFVGSGRWIINPETLVPSVVRRLTGLDPAELEGKPIFADIANELLAKINSADLIIAYNAKFDKKFFDNEFRASGHSLPDKPWLDPLVWARRLLNTNDHKLVTIAQHFKVSLENAHRAEADAKATALVAIEFVKKPPIDDALPDDLNTMLGNQNVWRDEHEAEFQARRKFHPTSKIKMNK